jgi:hypothetical protein
LTIVQKVDEVKLEKDLLSLHQSLNWQHSLSSSSSSEEEEEEEEEKEEAEEDKPPTKKGVKLVC